MTGNRRPGVYDQSLPMWLKAFLTFLVICGVLVIVVFAANIISDNLVAELERENVRLERELNTIISLIEDAECIDLSGIERSNDNEGDEQAIEVPSTTSEDENPPPRRPSPQEEPEPEQQQTPPPTISEEEPSTPPDEDEEPEEEEEDGNFIEEIVKDLSDTVDSLLP